MTNEELATLIQGGERDRSPELWEQVERFAAMQARKVASKIQAQRGVTAEDLYQCGYLAFVAAVETFSEEAGGSFLNWFMFYLKQEYAKWGGWRTERQKNEPLNNAASLDSPVRDSEDNDITLGDLQADPDSAQAFDEVECTIWRAELRRALDASLDQLPAKQAEIIRCRYFQDKTLSQIAQELGVSAERVRRIEENALEALRSPAISEPLEEFLEERTPYYLRVGAQQFHRTQTSAVEQIVLIRERLQQHFNPKFMKGDSTWTKKWT